MKDLYDAEIDRLKAENAELRELVRDILSDEERMDSWTMERDYEEHVLMARELGIEVEG